MIFSFETLNPNVILIYFILTIGALYSIENPVLILIFIVISIFINLRFCKTSFKRLFKSFILMSLLVFIINPLVSHKGTTILFYIKYTPITLESIFYGFISSIKLITLLFFSNYFNSIMTYERLIYILSPLGHNLSLIISLSIKFIPEYLEKITSIKDTQKTKGIHLDSDKKIDIAKNLVYILNAFFFVTLEDGIVTIKSIKARGYYNRCNTNKSKIKLRLVDYICIAMSVMFLTITLLVDNTMGYKIYPTLTNVEINTQMIISIIVYLLFLEIPIILEQGEKLYVIYKRREGKLFLSKL
ncbi:hypothetical protein CHL78_007615 [Romboutsia weinsteinii]|uniref:Energy-coupling factor transporter transmembrane protein EcfT n=1 Tax=Romboutsia weinsteinii TaxID=2020949 RepID=A0A371J506_9FIRM|nr:energy-coupling factor transporter transmembrane component T [Romboutsia weinsteinii]RDY27862.1 hypothetical protein CHL78_007615 [Romboutsia weinsteinii]